MGTFPTVNLPGGTDKTFKTIQLSPAGLLSLASLIQAPPPSGGTTGWRMGTSPGPLGVGAIGAADTLYLYPFIILQPISFTGGKLFVTTGGASSACKSGIWANSLVSNRPVGAPLFADNTGVATTSSGVEANVAFGNGSLTPGFYWMGTKSKATLPTMLALIGNGIMGYMMGAKTSALAYGLSIADTYTNNLATLAEGASFTEGSFAIPHVHLVSA
jgi:hypothetical protein